jgi:hypothetical protein
MTVTRKVYSCARGARPSIGPLAKSRGRMYIEAP